MFQKFKFKTIYPEFFYIENKFHFLNFGCRREYFLFLKFLILYYKFKGNIKAFSQLAKTKEYGFNSSDNLLYSDDIYLDDTLDTTPHSNKNSSENDAKLSGELCSEIGKEIIQMTLETQ